MNIRATEEKYEKICRYCRKEYSYEEKYIKHIEVKVYTDDEFNSSNIPPPKEEETIFCEHCGAKRIDVTLHSIRDMRPYPGAFVGATEYSIPREPRAKLNTWSTTKKGDSICCDDPEITEYLKVLMEMNPKNNIPGWRE